METEHKKALISMGYREIKTGIWGKPVGYLFFLFKMDKLSLGMYFKSIPGDTRIWTDETYETDTKHGLLGFIKAFEAYNFRTMDGCWQSSFEFITAEEILNIIL